MMKSSIPRFLSLPCFVFIESVLLNYFAVPLREETPKLLTLQDPSASNMFLLNKAIGKFVTSHALFTEKEMFSQENRNAFISIV